MQQLSLWGQEFNIPDPSQNKKLVNKIKNAKPADVQKTIKSKSVSLQEKLELIKAETYRVLGQHIYDTVTIKDKESLVRYIDAAVKNGALAVDTETNRSLDPITCKLMGPCFYTPGQKSAYIPINHVDPETGQRLPWQLTEQDVNEQLQRVQNIDIIMHHGKFDYQVIKCTCDVELPITWDTMVGARILDENEKSAGLKQQYLDKIDPEQEKYNIDSLFTVPYEYVDPEVFALYAATDAMMTYKLYEWQKRKFELPGNERLYVLFKTVEMPIVLVAANMELAGIQIDKDYSHRLSAKYHERMDELNKEIAQELDSYKARIAEWRTTAEANFHPRKKSGEEGGKSKSEQLSDPVNLTSPTQLAILIYDILKLPSVDKKSPRGTGEPVLQKLIKYDFRLGELILELRGLNKLLNTYIDKLPEIVNPKTGRLHGHFNTLGTDTGRFSSTEPNL